MEMVLKNGFCEMEEKEQYEIDGGASGLLAAIGAGAVKAATAVGAVCGMGAVGGAVVIGVCVVAVGAGIACAVNGVQ